MKKTFILLLGSAMLIMVSCESSPPMEQQEIKPFSREKMLGHWADNIIIPAYEEFGSKTQQLKSAAENFVLTPDSTSLKAMRKAWMEAYLSWQTVAMFSFGKPDKLSLLFRINLYPTKTTQIEELIAIGGYDLSENQHIAKTGFPALDYMLYGLGETDEEILKHYTTDPNAAGYLAYVEELGKFIDRLTQQVLLDWKADFKGIFISQTDNSQYGSIPRLVNDFVFYIEKDFRTWKIGIPMGRFTDNPLPTHVEAVYKGDISKDLALTGLDALQDFFNGNSANGPGPSIAAYLDHHKIQKGGVNLSDMINAQFDLCREKIGLLNNNFQDQITHDLVPMQIAFDEVHQLMILIRTDMLHAMDIQIDFVEQPGD